MKVLMISTDRNIFNEESDVGARMVMFGSVVDELHIIVLSLESDNLEALQLEDNVFVYPTNSKSRWHYFRDAQRIGEQLTDIDLITAQDPAELGSIALRLSKKHNIPFELQVHTDVFSKHFRDASRFNNLRSYLAKYNLRRASCVRVASDRVRRSLLVHANYRHHKIPITILPVFVHKNSIEHGEPSIDLHEQYQQFDNIVLVASRLVREKNIFCALEAFSQVLQQHPKTGMVIVGDGPLSYDLRKAAEDLMIGDSVMFEGWTDDLVSYFKTADAFLLTSNYEGYGRTLIEAALAGCSIVTTDVGVAGDILHDGEGALICPVGDTPCIASQLGRLMEDHNYRKKLSRNAYETAQKHVFEDSEAYCRALKASWTSCVS